MALGIAALLLFGLAGSFQDWSELKSEHFTLRTNLDREAALQALREAERTRAALVAAMYPPLPAAGIEPLDIIVLKDRTEFERYAGEGSRGLYSHWALPPRIVLWGTPDRWEQRFSGPNAYEVPHSRQSSSVMDFELQAHLELVRAGSSSVLRHELAHHVASAVYGRMPLWFSEGQAQFFESLKLSEDGRLAIIGLINPTAWLEYRRIRSVDAHDVLRWETPISDLSQGKSIGLYGGSWQLYQWLFTTHRSALRCYQEKLAARQESAAAWTQCFPDLRATDLDAALWEFSRTGHPALAEVAVPPVGMDVKMRGLSEAEVHLIRAQVALASPHLGNLLEEASNEVKQALTADPTLVGALWLVAPLVPPETRLEDGRRAVAAHMDDGWAWLLLADALWDTKGPSEERRRAYQRAVELLPDSPLVLARAARNFLSRNESLEALRLADRAAQLAPGNGEVLAIDALALAASGRCTEGMSLAREARAILPAGNVGLTNALDVGFARACAGTTPDDAGTPRTQL